jgi:hypothetical protein
MNEENGDILRALKNISEDVKAIRTYALLQARLAIIALLGEIAKTPERQQIWRLCDGTRSTEQISSEIGISIRSVQYFIQDADQAGLLVIERRGYPKRIENVIPSAWKAWRRKKSLDETPPRQQDNGGMENA